jgi:regulator of replication initiation timing
MEKEPTQLLYNLSALNQEHFKLCNDLYMLEVVRQKIENRGYQHFDRQDILDELGKLQGRLNTLHGKLVSIADTLKTL